MGTGSNGSAGEVFRAFLKLGVTAFGGPVAHLGFFRTEFVARRGWLDDEAYARIVALCQFLPGPASSQVGIALGFGRAGWAGAAAAWAGFTLPSALLMILAGLAIGAGARAGQLPDGLTTGLKIAALAVVVQAVAGMAGNLAPDRARRSVAAVAAVVALTLPGVVGQLGAILIGLLAALLLNPPAAPATAVPVGRRPLRRTGAAALLIFLAGLVLLPLWAATGDATGRLVDGMYRAGSLVFGGGHVVLPLLAAETGGHVDGQAFLAGYGLAQAVPGPLFTFSAFLGAAGSWGGLPGWLAGVIALIAIFVPAALLVVGALPFWDRIAGHPGARRAVAGVNAAVLGLLAAALYDPVFVTAVSGPRDAALAILVLLALLVWRLPVWALVPAAAAAGMAMAALG